MSRWRMSACAQTFVRTSVTVMRTSGLSSRCFCDELVRARHVGVDRQLEGRDRPRLRQPARDRLADVRERTRLDLAARSGGSRERAGSCRLRLARARRPRRRCARRARCRGAAASSMPRSRAMRRASGDALMRPFVVAGCSAGAGSGCAASASAAAASARRCFGASRSALGARALARRVAGAARPRPVADEADRLADLDLALGDRDLQQDAASPPPRPPASPCRCRARRAARPSRPARPPTSAT